MKRKKIAKYTLLIVALTAILAVGIRATRNDFGLGRNMEIMINLMRTLSTQYVDEVDADKMMRDGAMGICSKLDPYTSFLSEEDVADFETLTTGRYGGIGAVIRKKGDYVIIAEPYHLSPADRAGLKIGDKIVAINGESARNMSVEDVSKRLRGEPNSSVNITIERMLDGKQTEHRIRRERIVIPSIPYYGFVAPGIGYIRHADFTNGCYDDMRTAILALQAKGTLNGLILDYRNNGGGVLQSAIKVLSLFVPKGTQVVETKGRRKEESSTFTTEYEPLLPDTPIAVLINQASASAAEIVAGAIQDLDRGVLLGERSFGKGLVQATYPLGYNTMAKITTARYHIPSGRCIQATRYSSEGRAEHLPDSLINEFRTRGGRKVYDGGGIMPDLRVKPDYISNFAVTLYLLGLIEEYGDEYYRRHHAEPMDLTTFSITDSDYEEFKTMVMQREVSYKSESRVALDKLKEALDKERHGEQAALVAQLEATLRDDKASNLETFRKEIIESINANIILRHAYSHGVIEHSLGRDGAIQRAVQLLNDKDEYTDIVTHRDTARK